MKFKKGDMVLIKESWKLAKIRFGVNDEKKKWVGTIRQVKEHHHYDNRVYIFRTKTEMKNDRGDMDSWSFHKNDLEPITKIEQPKSDLFDPDKLVV